MSLSRCAEQRPSKLPGEDFEALLSSFKTPTVVFLWADWSRPSIEMLPTVAELASEYEGSGLTTVTVSLGREPEPESRQVLGRFPSAARHLTLDEDPSFHLARRGIQDIPAALIFGPGGDLLFTLGSTDDDALTPADLADAIEAALTARFEARP